MKNVTVKILVTVNDFSHFDACTLCFETLRVGWPTADIHIYVNGGAFYGDIAAKLERTAMKPIDLHTTKSVHHAEWIRGCIYTSTPGPLVIADADTVFWKSCEDWDFHEDVVLAGYFVPRMWNDFAKCVSEPRIHTSLMVLPNTAKLYQRVRAAYPLAYKAHGDYCPCEPFFPRVSFVEGKPKFWDSCSNLYNMLASIGHSPVLDCIHHFGPEQKSCYDHLNSASFYDCMVERLEGETKEGFKLTHREWVKNPTPGLWPLVDAYYKQKAIEAKVRL
jgi:hypothetical protein